MQHCYMLCFCAVVFVHFFPAFQVTMLARSILPVSCRKPLNTDRWWLGDIE